MGVIYQDYISCQAYSQCTIFGCLGVLPEVLYHFCGSAPTRVVQETCLLIREYSQCLLGPFLWEYSHKHGIAVLGVLPKTINYYWEYSQTCHKSGRSNLGQSTHYRVMFGRLVKTCPGFYQYSLTKKTFPHLAHFHMW